ncbi:hypothetical protein BH11PAT1_BH11PAT1_3830 [soil metagenome]
MNTILGIKQAQMQRFLEDGTRIPVTVIRVPQNVVVSVKTQEKDGYQAVQLGMGSKKKATKALLGHAKKANLSAAPKVLHEVKTTDTLPQGEFVAIASVLKAGDILKVTGMSKGKGFAGGVKRHGFKGGPRTHGQSDRERAPGSLGQTTTPGRVYKGKRMAGRMGHEITSVMNLVVVDVNEATQEILIKGLVPGNMGSVITLTKIAALPEKKIVALLPDPFAPVVEEVATKEVSKEDEVSNVSEGDSDVQEVALDDSKQEDTAAPEAQPAEEKVASEVKEEDGK